MALTTAARIAAAHVWFFREGDAHTVPSPGTCGRESKPGAADAGWISIGLIKGLSITPEVQPYERYQPSPGRKRLYEILHGKRNLTIKFTSDDMTPLALEHLFGSEKLSGSTEQFNPGEGTVKNGWLKVQCYGHDDELFLTFDVFVNLEVEGDTPIGGTDGGNDPVSFSYVARVLQSTLNTAGL